MARVTTRPGGEGVRLEVGSEGLRPGLLLLLLLLLFSLSELCSLGRHFPL